MNKKKKKWFSITKVVGIIALFYSIHLRYDVGVWAGSILILGKLAKGIILAIKGIDDEHK